MSTIRVSTTLAAIAAVALSALPVYAQDGRRGSGDGQDRPRAERRRPRSDNGGQSNEGRRAQADRGRRSESPRSEAPRAEAPRAEAPRADAPRAEAPRAQAVPRAERRPDNDQRRASRNDGRYNDRDNNRGRRVEPRRDSRDWRNDRGRNVYRYSPAPRAYRNYSRPSRVWAVPYGYRPRGYRPGWNVNLYFGRPYGYGRPGYYGSGGYGYYALPSGFVYGSVRIVDAPRSAQVFVDGYYAGEVDDYDGVFQRLNLEPGRHLVEIDVYQGAPPLEFDVYVEPGRTVTIHAR